MKMKAERTSGLSQPVSPTDESADFIVQHKHEPNSPLTEAMLLDLAKLEQRHDSEINYADVPELSDAELGEFHHRRLQSGSSGDGVPLKLKKAS